MCEILDKMHKFLKWYQLSHWGLTLPISFIFKQFAEKNLVKQDCIPVGCIPPTRRPYLPVCSVWGGGGACLVQGGACLVRGGGEVPAWSGGGGAWSWGVSAWSGWYPSMHWGRPPLWTESQTPVKILPCPNFVAGGNDSWLQTPPGPPPPLPVWEIMVILNSSFISWK